MANSSAVWCMLVQSCGRKDAFHSNHFGSGCDPRTLSTTIFRGRGKSRVSGRERKVRKAIPERCGQQLRHSPNTRIKIESLLLRPDKLPPRNVQACARNAKYRDPILLQLLSLENMFAVTVVQDFS